jgi:hypothetical protein
MTTREFENSNHFISNPKFYYRYFKNWLIIHEENAKKNKKSQACRVFICDRDFPCLTYFVFDFLDLHNVFFENYFANELTMSIDFEAIWNIHSACFKRYPVS